MKFESGKMYRHRNFLDVDMYVLNAEEGAFKHRLTVRYFNRFDMLLDARTDQVEISKDQSDKWMCLS